MEDHRAAAALISIYFEKAFNRMSHQHCITALRAKGAPDHLVGMVQAFLYQWKIRVKSEPRSVPGGSPPGSILANFLFCVTAEGLLDPPENSGKDFQANRSEHSVGSKLFENCSLSPVRRPDPPNTSDEENIRFFRRHKKSALQSSQDKTVLKISVCKQTKILPCWPGL